MGINVGWPFRSQGSQGREKRLRFQGYAPKSNYSSLGAHLLCSQLKRRNGLRTTNIGTEELANDISAKVITLAHITDTAAIEDLASEVLVLSPTEVLVDTAFTQNCWEDHISSIRRIGQHPPVKDVRWRQAKGGGVWAKPRGLKAGPMLRRAGRPLPGRISLTVQGTCGSTSHEHL